MNELQPAYLLRFFIDESDKHDGVSLYEWLLKKALEEKLKGATVLRGITGFGAHAEIHTTKILQLSTNLPIIVEIIDTRKKIEKFVSNIGNVVSGGMLTLQEIQFKTFSSSN